METNVGGIKVNYQVFGEGQPFLIFHGWGSSSERWVEVAEKISKKGYKVIVPDLPGFGKSNSLTYAWNTNKYITWIEQFIRELGIENYYVLGHSFGGALASKLAVKHVQNVKKLFLVSAACVRERTAKKSFSAKIAKVIKFFKFLPFYENFRKMVYKFIIRKSDYIYVDGIMKDTYLNTVKEDLSFHLPFIKVPTVIVWGEKDESTPIHQAHIINNQIKNSKLIIIPGVGHALNTKNPEILSEKVLDELS